MLVGNGVRYGGSPMRTMGGAQIGSAERGRWGDTGGVKCFHSGEATVGDSQKAAFPNGHNRPSAWILAQKAGGMSTYMNIDGAGALGFANLAGGLNGEASLSGSGQIDTADLVPIIQAVAALTGTGALTGDITGKLEAVAALAGVGSISTAQLNSLLNAAAMLAGSGALAADIVGKLDAAASLAGIGQITNADANMIVLAAAALAGVGGVDATIHGAWFMEGALSGVGSMTSAISAPAHLAAVLAGNGTLVATAYAPGDMSALISSATEELTAQGIALAVWEYATRTLTGSGGLSVDQDTRLLELWQVLGLDPDAPLTVTTTRRYVGDSGSPDIDQAIGGNGRTLSTVTREP